MRISLQGVITHRHHTAVAQSLGISQRKAATVENGAARMRIGSADAHRAGGGKAACAAQRSAEHPARGTHLGIVDRAAQRATAQYNAATRRRHLGRSIGIQRASLHIHRAQCVRGSRLRRLHTHRVAIIQVISGIFHPAAARGVAIAAQREGVAPVLDCGIAAHRAAIDHLHTVSAGFPEPAFPTITIGVYVSGIHSLQIELRRIVVAGHRQYAGIEDDAVKLHNKLGVQRVRSRGHNTTSPQRGSVTQRETATVEHRAAAMRIGPGNIDSPGRLQHRGTAQ